MRLAFSCLFVFLVFNGSAQNSALHGVPTKKPVATETTTAVPKKKEVGTIDGIMASKDSSIEKARQICDHLLQAMATRTETGNTTLDFNFNPRFRADVLSMLKENITEERTGSYWLVAEADATEVVTILQDIVNKNTSLTDTNTILNSNSISMIPVHVEQYLEFREYLRRSLKEAKQNGNVFAVIIEIEKLRPVVDALLDALDYAAATERGVIFVCGKECPNELEAIQEFLKMYHLPVKAGEEVENTPLRNALRSRNPVMSAADMKDDPFMNFFKGFFAPPRPTKSPVARKSGSVTGLNTLHPIRIASTIAVSLLIFGA